MMKKIYPFLFSCLIFCFALCLPVLADTTTSQYTTGGILPESLPDILSPDQTISRNPIEPPPYWNWCDVRGVNWMTDVKNQGGCGACAAFACCGAVEAMMNIWSNDPELDMDFSEQHLFACNNGECNSGLYMGYAFDYFTSTGNPDEDCWEYQAIDLDCSETCPDWQSRVTRLDNWTLLWQDEPDNDELKRAVWWQPIAVYLEIYRDFDSYSGGVYKYDGTSQFRGGHFVVIVGWDEELDCWICKNSWGPGWGENGYFRIAFNEVEIGSWAMDPDLDEPDCTHTGDVNLNGTVTAEDAQLTFLSVLGLYPLTSLENCQANCNADDLISAEDAQYIFQTAMGLGNCL